MNKQEILEEINKTEEYLINMEKILEECESERWKPKDGEKFFFIDAWNRVCDKNYKEISTCCREYYNTYNCFKTKEEAEAEAEKVLVRRMLEDIARRLNKGQVIDWLNGDKYKYSLHFSFFLNKISITYNVYNKEQGSVCCLDESFLDVAIKEIGEGRLKRYLRGE